MSVLIKDMGKPKSCYVVIDGESEYCPFVNTDDDCVILLEKGICEGTWADQYSKCPLAETPDPCDDAVSREMVSEWLKQYGQDVLHGKYKFSLMYIWKNLMDLPSVQPEQRWVLCKDRLPEEYVDVLAWFEYFRYGDFNCMYKTFGIGNYSAKYDSWTINHESGWHKLKVIAWMPLPEPYGGEQE